MWFSYGFAAVVAAVVAQRLLELRLARRNAARLKRMGGYVVGADPYRHLVAVHVAFFLLLIAEFALRRPQAEAWMAVPFGAFAALQGLRAWCIRSLGVYWNTRIVVVPGMPRIARGPYRYLKHPNYVVVTLELTALPLAFGCWRTALLILPWNLLVLRKRIAVEEEALNAHASPAG